MSRQQRGTGYVAALVARLGGDVVITDEEAAHAGELTIEHDRARNQTRILLKPEQLVGEIVTAEPQSITSGALRYTPPPKHQHETWQLARRLDGWLFCRACGEDVEHDPSMQVNQ